LEDIEFNFEFAFGSWWHRGLVGFGKVYRKLNQV
jgi:hypothetical protein